MSGDLSQPTGVVFTGPDLDGQAAGSGGRQGDGVDLAEAGRRRPAHDLVVEEAQAAIAERALSSTSCSNRLSSNSPSSNHPN